MMIARRASRFSKSADWVSNLVVLFCLTLAVSVRAGQAQAVPPVHYFLTTADNGTVQALLPGDTFTLTLECDDDRSWNLDTGAIDSSVLDAVEGTKGFSSYVTREGVIVVVGGDTWHFEARASGTTTLRAECIRYADAKVVDVFEVRVEVFVGTEPSGDVKDPNEAPASIQPFALVPLIDEMDDAIAGQRCVFPVTIVAEGPGVGAGGPVVLSASLLGAPLEASVSVEPNAIQPGEVAELTIIPLEPNEVNPKAPVAPDEGRPRGPLVGPVGPDRDRAVIVELRAERAGVKRSRLVEVDVLAGEDLTGETAAFYRDLFVPWLAKNHPGLGIAEATEWVGTIVKPHILVVTHYLFFSSEWEMGVRWHVMIPPHDWAEIYLRHRDQLSSTRAWRIHSVEGGQEPEVTQLPAEGVFR